MQTQLDADDTLLIEESSDSDVESPIKRKKRGRTDPSLLTHQNVSRPNRKKRPRKSK